MFYILKVSISQGIQPSNNGTHRLYNHYVLSIKMQLKCLKWIVISYYIKDMDEWWKKS